MSKKRSKKPNNVEGTNISHDIASEENSPSDFNCDDDIKICQNEQKEAKMSKTEQKCSNETKYYCEKCDYITDRKSNYNKHMVSKKHNDGKKNVYVCEKCNYISYRKNNYERHLISSKHNDDNPNNENINDKIQLVNNGNGILITPELIMLLIQQNKEMQQMMLEQQNNYMKQQNIIIEKVIENGGNNNNNNNSNNTINDNKSFNLNFFLNETCKNAMNLSDFVNGVDISLDDFEETGRIGYVEGLSRVFCKELKKLHFTERPIHCSDLKRETIYIRENNRWEKDENKEKLLRAVKQIGKKNIKVLTLWQEKYPGYKDVESKENDRYLHILTNIMCGETEEEIQSNYGKIMKNISKVTVVDKK
jgi:hypothetical protein